MAEPVLGFVGAGFVGGAMIRAFSGFNERVIYDKGLNIGSLQEVKEKHLVENRIDQILEVVTT